MRVDLSSVSFGYNKKKIILKDISFSVNSSESIAIVGASGCGKSTLLRLVCGLLPNLKGNSFSGNVLIDNKDILANKSEWGKVRENGKIGFMFQSPELLPFLNLRENVQLSLEMTKQQNEEKVSDFLKKTGLEKDKDKLPSQLSGGMRTRVALARTFITNPELLLLDEPFSSLDIVWKSRLYEEVRALKNAFNTTIMLVTHDIFEAIFFSPKIIILGNNGRIISSIAINNWSDKLHYNDIVTNYYNDFICIKELIENQ